MQAKVTTLLKAGAFLTGSSSSEAAPELKDVLLRRLSQYYKTLELVKEPSEGTLEEVQLETATGAFDVIESLQDIVVAAEAPPVKQEPQDKSLPSEAAFPEAIAIGTRDLGHIRTLTSIAFKWAAEPLLRRLITAIPSRPAPRRQGAPTIIDLTGVPADYDTLSSLLRRVVRIVLPGGSSAPLSQSVISTTLLNRHLTDLLKPALVLGWLPKSLATDSVRPLDSLRQPVLQLLSALPASQTISALGGVLADPPCELPYVRKTCSFLLGRQLMRPDGVPGLFMVIFGEEDVSGEDAPLEKLEHIGRVLCSIPVGIKPEDYYNLMIPRLISILARNAEAIPPAHRRAAAFALSRMLASDSASEAPGTVQNIMLPLLHSPFLETSPAIPGEGATEAANPQEKASRSMTVSSSLFTLQTLLTNADPSPTFISSLLTPIGPTLYTILYRMNATKTSDPALKESVRSMLATWGRVIGASEGVEVLWRVVLGEGGEWKVDVAGELTRAEELDKVASLALFTPESLEQAEEAGEFSLDANPLDLRPDPVHFVAFLKSLDRGDVASGIFTRLLEAYRELKAEADADPLRTLLYLQLILQMQQQLAEDNSASNILSKPDDILSFIKHALDSVNGPPQPSVTKRRADNGLRMQDLHIVEEEEEDMDGADSDDEVEEGAGSSTDEEMTTTTVNLLLSILEANPELSARTAPILNDIFSLLEPLAKEGLDTLRPLAREARMVMTARLASTSAGPSGKAPKKGDEESPQQIYQKALKLLQDPILPVRAHGLLLLRQLVSARKTTASGLENPALERALVPAILSIFLQSLQDDDSYVYLNAVQGLSAMVDGFGREVLHGLVDVYAQGLDGLGGSSMTQQDVDVRTRVGEALGQVIRRCGDALPGYVNVLVPPLFAIVRAAHFPTILRTSALSLLAQCARTNSLALLYYTADLVGAMIDLLQLESVSVKAASRRTAVPSGPAPAGDEEGDSTENAETPRGAPTMDSQPTSTNSKFPPLRRAALHFLSLLIQACTTQVYESASGGGLVIPEGLAKRARTTLAYMAATDEDAVVRAMARETTEGLDQLAEALVGA